MTSHEQKSRETKDKLASSLKNMMQQTDFNKISINDLVKDAGLNRNSFYYHFGNVFDLLNYIFETDAAKIIQEINFECDRDLKRAVYLTMDYIDKNRAFCTCAYKSLGKNELRKFLNRNFQNIITVIIDHIITQNNFHISDNFKKYIIYSQTGLIAIHTIGYLENQSELSKEQLADYTTLLFNSSVVSSLKIANDYGL